MQKALTGVVRSFMHYIYLKAGEWSPLLTKADPERVDAALWGEDRHSAVLSKVAFLCDEMTWQDFKDNCDAIFLHPSKWREQMELFRPDIFFCEAAWSGIQMFDGVWRGRVYRDRRVLFDNRQILLEILNYCQSRGISTVFWSKEDPTYFQHPVYDFTQTAMKFDIIFTTAQECVHLYEALGHRRVYLLPFGVDTDRFCTYGVTPQPDTVVFAGSWFADQPQRCQDLERLLDFSIAQGWHLDIYDRKYSSREKRFQFPKKYRSYIRPAVAYEMTPELFRRYEYGINVNTVVHSPTMCSRRLLQLAASGTTVLSNEAGVFSTLSDCLDIWYAKEKGIIFAKGNAAEIERRYSIKKQFNKILDTIEEERERAIHGARMA